MERTFLAGGYARNERGTVYAVRERSSNIVLLMSKKRRYLRCIQTDKSGNEYVVYDKNKTSVIWPMS